MPSTGPFNDKKRRNLVQLETPILTSQASTVTSECASMVPLPLDTSWHHQYQPRFLPPGTAMITMLAVDKYLWVVAVSNMYICIILDNEYKYNRTRCDTVVISSRYYIWLLEQTWARTDWQFLASLSLPSQSSPSLSSWPKVSKALRRWAFCHPWKLWKTNQWSCHPVQIVLLRRIGQVGRFRTLAVAKRIQETKKKQAKEVREAEVHSTLHTGSETVKASLIFWNLIESEAKFQPCWPRLIEGGCLQLILQRFAPVRSKGLKIIHTIAFQYI